MKPSQHVREGIFIIHPNDGSDLGLYVKTHPIKWCAGFPTKDFIEGQSGNTVEVELQLLNECAHETLEMNMKQWKEQGSPKRAIALIDGNRFLINNLPDPPKED